MVRACLSILELCERFRDSSQASGASQRVQRASDALPLIGRCAGWPCTPWPFARPQPDCRFAFVVVCHSPSRSGSLPCLRGDRSARRRVFSSVLCAARGQRVLRGTEWTLCAPIGCVALDARCVRFWRRARHEFFMARVRPQPFLHCARTCCSQRGPVLAVLRFSLVESRGAARAGSSFGRWRCGSCVAVRLIALGFARLGRLPG